MFHEVHLRNARDFTICSKDRPIGDHACRVRKILLAMYGIGWVGEGVYRKYIAKKPFKIEHKTWWMYTLTPPLQVCNLIDQDHLYIKSPELLKQGK